MRRFIQLLPKRLGRKSLDYWFKGSPLARTYVPRIPVDQSLFCEFGRFSDGDVDTQFIQDIIITDANNNIRLMVGPYTSQGVAAGRDATDSICVASPGETLTMYIHHVNLVYDCYYYAFSWGHTIGGSGLQLEAHLAGLRDGCLAEVSPYDPHPGSHEHEFDWVVPDVPGTHMVSWWVDHIGWHWTEGDFDNENFSGPCDEDGYHTYGDRVDCTLIIE